MSTPTCRTCETKFPGKDVCKTCGADPGAEPTLDYKIERAKAAPAKAAFVAPARLSLKSIAKAFDVPSQLVADKPTRVKERNARRARVRSLQNTRTSGRGNKHGRQGVRG